MSALPETTALHVRTVATQPGCVPNQAKTPVDQAPTSTLTGTSVSPAAGTVQTARTTDPAPPVPMATPWTRGVIVLSSSSARTAMSSTISTTVCALKALTTPGMAASSAPGTRFGTLTPESAIPTPHHKEKTRSKFAIVGSGLTLITCVSPAAPAATAVQSTHHVTCVTTATPLTPEVTVCLTVLLVAPATICAMLGVTARAHQAPMTT